MTMNNRSTCGRRGALRNAFAAVALACACWGGTAGCTTIKDLLGKRKGEDEKVRQMASTDDVRGPLQRFLESGRFTKETPLRYTTPPEGQRKYDLAEARFKRGDLKGAKQEFERVAKEYKDT